MATIDKTGCGPTYGKIPYAGLNKTYVISNTVDLTAQAMSTDTYQCLAIPAGTVVSQVRVHMLTAAVGTTLTATVGDGSATTGWDASEDHKGAAGTIYTSLVGTDTYAVGETMGTYYATADSIDVAYTVATAITAGPKFRISAVCIDCN